MAEMQRCWICRRSYPRETLWTLNGWDATYYVCLACVDVMRDHARSRLAESEHELDVGDDDWAL